MEIKLTILAPFFEEPYRSYSIRELARLLDINHTSVRQHLNKLVDEGFLTLKQDRVYSFYNLALSKNTLNLKMYYNLEKIRKSGLIEDLEKAFELPVIVLFGSYSKASDSLDSDIDLCLISEANRDFNFEEYEKTLNRKVSLHKFNRNSFNNMKKTNKNLINNICNGIVLSGQLEIL